MINPSTVSNCNYCGIQTQGAAHCCRACEILDSQIRALPILSEAQNPFSHLDQKEFRDLYRHKGHEDFNFLFFAEGLHCSSCVHLLEKLPQFYEHIARARVNFAQSTVAIQITDEGSLAQAAHVIQELGYKPTLLSPQDNVVEKYKEENRGHLKRIAVAGFCAGNTMLFVIPVYAGLAGTWAEVFNFLSFLLFLPILFYSAVPFYKGAWNSLKYQVINVDLPITVAMLSGFALSTVNLLKHDGVIYYDSTASFIFFILSARYLLKRVQQNYLSPTRVQSFFRTEKYLRVSDSEEKSIPWSHAQVGDLLKVQRHQTLPSDCVLESPQGTLDMSLFNGESMPKTFSQGMKIFAGTKVLDESLWVRVQVPFSESKLGQLLKQLDQSALQKSHFVTLSDKLAQKLIVTVFAIALVFFFFYMSVNPTEAFNRSLALIVLACPCALAFGSPLTLGLALKKAQKLGILLKDATSLERIQKVKNIFFDKTGTLTEGNLQISHSEPAAIPQDIRKIILSLEASSYHPVAFALRKAWLPSCDLHSVSNGQEILGRGVSGSIEGSHYEIRHLAESTHEVETGIEVLRNGQSLCRIYFVDALRNDSRSAVRRLQRQGLDCFLLSGDKKSRALQAAEACGIAKENTFGELFPEDKKAILERHSLTCMIGDGANDSLSLQTADVGIAVKGSVDLSLQSADIYFMRGGLSPLFDLMDLGKQTRHVLMRNLTISLVYNALGGTLALLGFINPMMAAILMPLSSLAIILSSLWGFR